MARSRAILGLGVAARRDDGRPPADRRKTGARRRAGHAHVDLREARSPLVRLLRPPPDRPADEPRDGRPAGRALLPRLRPHLLLPAHLHDRRRRPRHLPDRLAARPDLADDRPVPDRRRVSLQPCVASAACATFSRRWPTSRPSRRRTSSASTSSSRSRRNVPSRRSSSVRSEEVFALSVKANRQRAFYVPMLSFLPLLSQAAILLVGGRMVADGSLSVGSFVRFNLYLAMLVMPLRALGMWIGQAQRATASGERIFQVIDEPEEIGDTPGADELAPGPGRVTFDSVTFGYDPERPVLRAIDLELDAGKVGRADRPHRLGQDEPRLARAPLLRRPGGLGVDRRGRRAPGDARIAAPRDRRDRAGSLPLLRDRSREHRLRRARRDRRGGRARGAPGAGARVRRGAARRATTP